MEHNEKQGCYTTKRDHGLVMKNNDETNNTVTKDVIRTGLEYTVIHRENTEGNVPRMGLVREITSGNQKAEN